MNISVQRQYHTCTAHFLNNYEGKCANLHGHNYVFTAEVTLSGESITLDQANMLTDFGELKRFFQQHVEPWDHAVLVPHGSGEVKADFAEDDPHMRALMDRYGLRNFERVIGFGENPTAEAMCRRLAFALADMIEQESIGIPDLRNGTTCFCTVTTEETPGCSARATVQAEVRFRELERQNARH
jgi:6-pyruvoyl-tetrahydropterin synthase